MIISNRRKFIWKKIVSENSRGPGCDKNIFYEKKTRISSDIIDIKNNIKRT